MGKTNTVLIVFDGDQVPFNVYYRGAEYKRYLHKKRTEVCDKCGAVGHRSDVCPKPNAVICTLCGTANPATAHPCTLKCLLCGQAHQTDDKKTVLNATRHLAFSFIAAKKGKLQQQQYLSTTISTQDVHPERQEVKPSDARCRSPSPTSKRRGSRSRSNQRRKNQPQELLLGSAAPEASDAPPPPSSAAATRARPRHPYEGSNLHEHLGSDHYIIRTIVNAGPPRRKSKQPALVDWDVFREMRATASPESATLIDQWTASLLRDVKRATKTPAEDAAGDTVDTKLLHM
ncbi:hypothetical protein HPB51_014986 [Rhipicephalus microplus]|uniref:CCHC-type domain-containing protein n=1 Tax=Rhipicephalus microplus TaxID=6941 RepID=A0A9J6DGR4_RHIMP|nr:hypothetical protein HPB51_014986 [Rhipicephalus microplus]